MGIFEKMGILKKWKFWKNGNFEKMGIWKKNGNFVKKMLSPSKSKNYKKIKLDIKTWFAQLDIENLWNKLDM